MDPTNPPKFLYRYRALGRPRTGAADPDEVEADTFRKAALYFPSRTQFNDPFDCLMPDMSHISDQDFHDLMVNRAKEEFLEMPESQRAQYAEEMHSLGRPEIERILQEYVDRLGVLSLSGKPDNATMWAHYANNHKGMCLEFDTRDPLFRAVRAVTYTPTAPKFVPGAHSANAEAFLLYKEIKWTSEEEWRIIGPQAKQLYPFNPTALTRVIFGASCPASDIEKVRTWIAAGPCAPRLCKAVIGKAYRIEIAPM